MSAVARIAVYLLAVLLPIFAVAETPAEDDVTAIRHLQDEQAAAWNAHDAVAYAALFTSDGDVVNVLGWWWKGRDEIREKLKAAFTIVFKQSSLKIGDVQVRMLSRDIAVAHVRWTLQGAQPPPGAAAAPQHGIQLQVLERGEHGWRIASFQNTNSVPEQPFPVAAPQR